MHRRNNNKVDIKTNTSSVEIKDNKVNIKTNTVEIKGNKTNRKYPSSSEAKEICIADYNHIIENYNKLYDKINIAIALCSVVFALFISKLDFGIVKEIENSANCKQAIFSVLEAACNILCGELFVWAIIELLWLLRSKKIHIVDSMIIRKCELYNLEIEDFDLFLIKLYTDSIEYNNELYADKQSKFDKIIIRIIISIILFAIAGVL